MINEPAAAKVLVVEDDETAAELERRTLHRAGYEVCVVGTLADARRALISERFDALLLDYNLPDGEPWALVEQARASAPRVPVVLITAAGSEPIVAQALQRGVGDYIRKSSTYLSDLPRVLDRVCSLARAEEGLRRSGSLFKLIAEHGEDMILTLEPSGHVRYISAACRRLLGFEMTDLAGTAISSLVHPDDDCIALFQLGAFGDGSSPHCEIFRMRHRDGHYVWVESNLQHVKDEGSPQAGEIIAITRDVTARMTAQRRVEAALQEKTVLLNEVHHRVKNNLQIIISLLKLQRESSGALEVHAAMLESESRIRAMSLIHQFLYEQKNFSRLDLTAYLRELGHLIERAHQGLERGIELRVQSPATPIWLAFDQAVPCGLFVNELLTNAYKHAFPDARSGRIALELYSDDSSNLHLIVKDDGVGLPAGLRVTNPESLGLKLAEILIDQLGGRWIVERAVQGARFDITFPTRDPELRSIA